MAPSKLRKAIGAVKDRTSIGIAKVSGSTSMSDLEVSILKATCHDEYPAEERHVMEILSLTSYSKAFISSCVNLISKRLNKTKNWTVALKTLMLVHRLLLDGDPSYEQEMFFATRRGTRLLNMSDFRDKSRSGSWDFSSFVRTYALYLDEQLEYRMHGRQRRASRRRTLSFTGGEFDHNEEFNRYRQHQHQIVVISSAPSSSGGGRHTPVRDMMTDRIFIKAQHLLQLLERFLACRPTGIAKANRVVLVALYPMVRESFQMYYDITEIMGVLIDRFMEMEIPDCVKVHDFFGRISKQFDELDVFYSWCKSVGIARSSEYPEVEKIPLKKLDLMDEFIREKSALEHKKAAYMSHQEQRLELTYKDADQEQEKAVKGEEESANEIKALPPPEGFSTDESVDQKKDDKMTKNDTRREADLLNLGEDAMTREEQGDRLALALFEGDASRATNDDGQDNQKWAAFTSGDSSDWEAALVQSTSLLNKQNLALAGGFDMLLLDGMYKQPVVNHTAPASNGSLSSFAQGSAGAPTMLALPAPPVPENSTSSSGNAAGTDPFAASLVVAPPAYVQMSEMEKKQRLLMEEQVMWQQYAREGMKGHFGVPQNPYGNMGGYNRSYY